MKKYVFIRRPVNLPESLVKNQTVLDLVRKISYLDMISALVNDLGFVPSDAEQAAGMLMRHANHTMPMPTGNFDHDGSNGRAAKDRAVPGDTGQIDQNDEMFPHRETLHPIAALAQPAIPPYVFPDEEEDPEEWPYDDATKGVMNTPYAGTPRMTT